ncbi:MAG: TRAP transporter TatT component family protein [bacterium]|nr:TRAP transporter TatT component family protein [bacterium]
MNRIAMKATKPLISATFSQILDEPDLMIAKSAVESDLKLLEGILVHRPKDRELLELAALGYTAYAMAFAEDDDPVRASELYQRGRMYAKRGLCTYGVTDSLFILPPEQLERKLAKLPSSANGLIVWGGLAWGLQIIQSLDNPELIADLPRVTTMVNLIRERDSTYFYGITLLFFGVLDGFRPKMMGGNPEVSEQTFDRCRSITNGRFLLERVYRARYLYVPTMNEERFRSELQAVIDAPIDCLPNNRLLTAIAKAKAKRYLAQASDWF